MPTLKNYTYEVVKNMDEQHGQSTTACVSNAIGARPLQSEQ
jgi:hypothetical protein